MRSITKLAICGVACLGLRTGMSYAAEQQNENLTVDLKQVLLNEVPADKFQAVSDLVASVLATGTNPERLEEIRSTYNLSADFVRLASSSTGVRAACVAQAAQVEGDNRLAQSDRASLKNALVVELGPEAAAPLFEQLQQALAKGADPQVILAAAELSRDQLRAIAPAVMMWSASATGDAQ